MAQQRPAVMLTIALGLGALMVLAVAWGRGGRGAAGTKPASTPVVAPTPAERSGPAHQDELDRVIARRDAGSDDWDTEVVNDLAGAQLKALGKLLAHPEQIDEPHLSALAAAQFTCAALRPDDLRPVYQDEAITVSRCDGGSPTIHEGLTGFADALRAIATPFDGADDVHVKFKIIRVELNGDAIETDAYYLAGATPASGAVQQNATWTMRWTRSQAGDLLLRSIDVSDFDEVIGPAESGTLFADCTEAVLANNPSFEQQMLKGTNHWRSNTQASLGIDLFGHQGLALGDVNGDGLDDLYVCQPGGIPNRLFVQNPDGTATDASASAGLDILDRSRSALFLDLDNDGDQDLVLITDTTAVLFANDGAGKFTTQNAVEVGTATTLTAADYDNDGDLDVYVCGYSAPTGGENAPIPYHDANNGYRNRLLRNDGGWTFTDVTDAVGLDADNTRYTLSASWEDIDNDGDMDLYVANDFGRNCLYRNDGGRFVNVAPQAGVEDISAGMGVTFGDYNNDGLMDIYVSNMFSSAGNRVAYQRRFRTGDALDTRSMFQRHARGNSLFENVGDGTFRDASVEAGVTMGRWAWGSLFFDLNNDGLEDIIVTNGMATNEDYDDL